jgi:hypothetical protein
VVPCIGAVFGLVGIPPLERDEETQAMRRPHCPALTQI